VACSGNDGISVILRRAKGRLEAWHLRAERRARRCVAGGA